MENEQLRSALKQIFIEELQCIITDLAKSHCYGCSVDHPSQIQHDICIMSTTDEWTDMFLEKAIRQMNLENVKQKWDLELREKGSISNQPSVDTDLIWNQMSKTFKILVNTSDGIEEWSKHVKKMFAD